MTTESKTHGCSTFFLVLIGMAFSGLAAVAGAGAAGRNFNAGYPFPDFMAWGLFLLGLLIVPLGVSFVVLVVRGLSRGRVLTTPLSILLTILFVSPVVSWVIGYRMQTPYTRHLAESRKLNELRAEAYRQFREQIEKDPEIVLRERWFEWDSTDKSGAKAHARWDVYVDSFELRESKLKVHYTVDQLRRIYEQSPFSRPMVATHPLCPPELIEAIWPTLFTLRDSTMADRVIANPATPLHLLEEHGESTSPNRRDFDYEVEKALKRRTGKP